MDDAPAAPPAAVMGDGPTMPATLEFLAGLRQQGVRLWAEGGRLNYSAPPGVVGPELRAELARRKPELLALLQPAMAADGAAPIAPADRAGPLPLSYQQERLWLLEQLDPGHPAYVITSALRLSGALDPAALAGALADLVARHESLRTTFTAQADQPAQQVQPPAPATLAHEDLSGLPPDEQADRLPARLAALAHTKFDLVAGPLWQATLLRLGPAEHVFVFAVHHIIADAWSLTVLYRELSALYEARRAGQPAALPPLPIQYADYAAWQRATLTQARLAPGLAYWRQHLAGAPAASTFPPGRTPPAASTRPGGVVRRDLPAPLAAQLQALCQGESVTRFMALLAVFDLLLYRYTGQTDLVVGAPIAGRDRPEVEGLAGVFLNHLALRVDLAGDPTFRALLGRARAAALAGFAHQAVPFEQVLIHLHPERSRSRTPLFQCFLNVMPVERAPFQPAGLRVEPVHGATLAANFDLTLYVRVLENRVQLRLVFNRDLYEAAAMEQWLDQFLSLLDQVTVDPDRPLSAYSLVTPAARTVLPDPVAPLDETWHGPVQARLAAHAQAAPHALALSDPQGQWTYAELEARTNQLARVLAAAGLERGEVVAIYAQRSAALAWAVLGALKAGAAFLILDLAYPAGRLADYLALAQPRGLLHLAAAGPLPDELSRVMSTLPLRGRWYLPDRPDGRFDAHSTAPLPLAVGPDDLAYVSFTSGSTGAPKGVLGRHGPLSHFLPWQAEYMGLSSADRFSLLSGLAHDPLQRDLFTALWVGASLHAPAPGARFEPGRLARWLVETGITVAHLTPPLSQLIVDTAPPGTRAPALRWAFFVGDKLTRPDVQRLRSLAPNVECLNTYGATETQRAVGYYRIPDLDSDDGRAVYPLGQGMPGSQLLVLNTGRQLCGLGELGEIYLRSPHLARGYLGDEALTQARFLPSPFTANPQDRLYRTGDLGRYLADGTVVFAGRADRQLKVRGFRVEPGEIEAALRQHPAVREAVVVARELLNGEAVLTAYAAAEATEAELRGWLQGRLPDFMLPAALAVLPALPLTPNGKIDLDALPAPANPGAPAERAAPRDEVERQLAALWQEVLGVPAVGPDDSFFKLGGHSLLAIRLFSRIESVFGRRLALAALFEAPTLAGLARHLRAPAPSANPEAWPVLVPIQAQGQRPPFFCVHDVGGTSVRFAELGQLMGSARPFYALEARGFDGATTPHTTIETMAADYLAAVRQAQPRGPYYLGGYCLGGVVAYEMARQLRAQGEVVALVAVIEGYAPTRHLPGERWWQPRRIAQYLANLPGWLEDHWELGPRYWWTRFHQVSTQLSKQLLRRLGLWRSLSATDVMPSATALPPVHVRVLEALLRASGRYRPGPYDGRVTLFSTRRQSMLRNPDRLRGWQHLAQGGVAVRRISGSHHTILEPRHVGSLARALREELDKLQSS